MRFLVMLLLLVTSRLTSASELKNTGDEMTFPSTIGSLKLFMRHQAPTGPRRGPPVLIIHGATFPSGNAAAWKIGGRSWMDELAAAGYDVFALDFLGYGHSDRYPEMRSPESTGPALGGIESMLTQVERAVTEILKTEGGDRVNLIAHSAGTFAAARYAQLHPDRVSRLVLFGAPAPAGGPSPGSEAAQPPSQQRYIEVSREDQLNAFESKVRDTGHLDIAMFDGWASTYLASDPESVQRQPASVRVPAGMSAAADEMDRRGQLPYDPRQITVPALVIQGEWDSVAPVSAGAWLFSQLGSPLKRLVVLSQAGHRVHLETNRWQLYRETEAFLLGGDSAAGSTLGVFFEVKPNGPKGRDAYLAEAQALRSKLSTMSGFISIERFNNQTRPGWLLSLSQWRDESALVGWREVFEHRVAQDKGRHGIFEDYRIRVARQVADGGDFVLLNETGTDVPPAAQHFVGIAAPEHRVALSEDARAVAGSHWQVIRDYGMHDRRQAPRP